MANHTHSPVKRAARVWFSAYIAASLVLIAVGLVLVHVSWPGGGRSPDSSIARYFADGRAAPFETIAKWGTQVGNTLPVIAVAAVMTALLSCQRKFRAALLLVTALTLELAVFLTVNFAVGRPRPAVADGPTPSTNSFPSGHSAAAVALYAGMAYLAVRCAWPAVVQAGTKVLAVAVPLFVGWARIYRGMHFASDVACGLVLGAFCLCAAVYALRQADPARSTRRPAPAATPSDSWATSSGARREPSSTGPASEHR